jgi:hypothetical protein
MSMLKNRAMGLLASRRLATTVLVAAALAASTSPGQAAPPGAPTACPIVTDPSGDAGTTLLDSAAELDITSGDVAMDQRTLTAVIRLAELTKQATTPADGRMYDFNFSANGKHFILRAALVPGGEDYDYQAFISDRPASADGVQDGGQPRSMTGIGSLTGLVDARAREVHISGPLSLFRKHVTFRQTTLSNLAVVSYEVQGYNPETTPQLTSGSLGTGSVVDEAYSAKEYRPYAPSCARRR